MYKVGVPLAETMRQIVGKRAPLKSIAAATRLVTRHGVKILEKLEGVRLLKIVRRQAYRQRDEKTMLMLSKGDVAVPLRKGATEDRLDARVYHNVDGRLSELRSVLGLPRSHIVEAALIAGLSNSCGEPEGLVPNVYRADFEEQLYVLAYDWEDQARRAQAILDSWA